MPAYPQHGKLVFRFFVFLIFGPGGHLGARRPLRFRGVIFSGLRITQALAEGLAPGTGWSPWQPRRGTVWGYRQPANRHAVTRFNGLGGLHGSRKRRRRAGSARVQVCRVRDYPLPAARIGIGLRGITQGRIWRVRVLPGTRCTSGGCVYIWYIWYICFRRNEADARTRCT